MEIFTFLQRSKIMKLRLLQKNTMFMNILWEYLTKKPSRSGKTRIIKKD